MAISAINNNAYSTYSQYGKIASGNKLPTAADGAAELAISEEMNRVSKGMDVGTNNQASARDMLNVQDQALGSITDHLQRIRELSLQAMNTVTVTDNDRKSIQEEIDQLKQGISDIANQTTFNTKNILNGTQTDFQLATDSNGNGTTVNTGNATLDALGLSDYDVTKKFDITKIDNALQSVTSQRAESGAQTNRLEYGMNYNRYSSQLTTQSRSRLTDLDIPKAVSNLKKTQTLQTYQNMMQKKKMEDARNQSARLFGSI